MQRKQTQKNKNVCLVHPGAVHWAGRVRTRSATKAAHAHSADGPKDRKKKIKKKEKRVEQKI